MLVCTVYILIGMAFTTTIIELVRYVMNIISLVATFVHQAAVCRELACHAGVESSDSGAD